MMADEFPNATKRPWRYSYNNEVGCPCIVDEDVRFRILNVHGSDSVSEAGDEANARLIVTAVNSYEALRSAVEAALPIVEWYAKLLEDPWNRAPIEKTATQLRAALNPKDQQQ